MPLGSGVCDATHFEATHDDVHSPFKGGLCRPVGVVCVTYSERVLALVRQQVLEMALLEEIVNLKE